MFCRVQSREVTYEDSNIMKKRSLGRKGIPISEVGLGCWQLGDGWGDEIAKSQALGILEEAVARGISFFDTADVYGGGRSEEIIGEFRATTDAKVHVATKFGRSAGVFPDNYSEQALREAVDASRKRLRTDCLDLLQLHCIPQPVLEDGRVFNWLRKLQQEGHISSFGASVESVEEGLICLEQDGLQSLQVIYNIFRQKLTTELLPQAHEKGVGIIVRLPLASGLLTGKFSSDTVFPENDHRNFNRDGQLFNVGETFAGLPFELGVRLSDELKVLLPHGTSLAQFALRWILEHPEVTAVIPGASSALQVRENASVSGLRPIPQDLMHRLRIFYQQEVHPHIRGSY